MSVVDLPQSGGCLCGALRYSLNAAPLLAYACHCHGCQKRSGAAFTLTLVVRTADMEITGPSQVFTTATSTGRVFEQNSCPVSRIHVFSRAPAAPDYMSLRGGCLDDASWVVPISQSFVEEAIPWAVIPGVAVVPWADFDFVAQGEAWTATAPQFRRAPS